eukprot:Clim_evm8s213 gene=Clim_evmTU8s213
MDRIFGRPGAESRPSLAPLNPNSRSPPSSQSGVPTEVVQGNGRRTKQGSYGYHTTQDLRQPLHPPPEYPAPPPYSGNGHVHPIPMQSFTGPRGSAESFDGGQNYASNTELYPPQHLGAGKSKPKRRYGCLKAWLCVLLLAALGAAGYFIYQFAQQEDDEITTHFLLQHSSTGQCVSRRVRSNSSAVTLTLNACPETLAQRDTFYTVVAQRTGSNLRITDSDTGLCMVAAEDISEPYRKFLGTVDDPLPVLLRPCGCRNCGGTAESWDYHSANSRWETGSQCLEPILSLVNSNDDSAGASATSSEADSEIIAIVDNGLEVTHMVTTACDLSSSNERFDLVALPVSLMTQTERNNQGIKDDGTSGGDASNEDFAETQVSILKAGPSLVSNGDEGSEETPATCLTVLNPSSPSGVRVSYGSCAGSDLLVLTKESGDLLKEIFSGRCLSANIDEQSVIEASGTEIYGVSLERCDRTNDNQKFTTTSDQMFIQEGGHKYCLQINQRVNGNRGNFPLVAVLCDARNSEQVLNEDGSETTDPDMRLGDFNLVSVSIARSATSTTSDLGNGSGLSRVYTDYLASKSTDVTPFLQDFSYAGYHWSEVPPPENLSLLLPTFNVVDFGAIPNDGRDDTEGIRAAIQSAAEACSGAVVYLPEGVFQFGDDGRLVADATSGSSEVIPAHHWTATVSSSHVHIIGAGRDLTELRQVTRVEYDNDDMVYHFALRVEPGNRADTNGRDRATVTADASRNSQWVSVSSTDGLRVGELIELAVVDDVEYAEYYWGSYKPFPESWSRWQESVPLKSRYTIDVVDEDKKRIKLVEVLLMDMTAGHWEVRGDLELLEEVGISDLTLSGVFDQIGEPWIHHKNLEHNYGWQALWFRNVHNGYVRNVDFKNSNTSFRLEHSSGVTVANVRWTGEPTHSSLVIKRSNHVVVAGAEDLTVSSVNGSRGMRHFVTVSDFSAGIVLKDATMNPDQSIDSHGNIPHTNLWDNVKGGILDANGGPLASFPNHARWAVFWNFCHTAKEGSGHRAFDYNFWALLDDPSQSEVRHTFLEPLVVGLHGQDSISTQHTLLTESMGTAVEPVSLYDAQLQERRDRLGFLRDYPFQGHVIALCQ